jgi:dihydropteroate synthase
MYSFDCNGLNLDLTTPVVMGILNLTHDSFYDGGKHATLPEQLAQVERMLSEGASVIDVGAVSTRPGAAEVNMEDEILTLIPFLDEARRVFPETIFSVDTFRSGVAKAAFEHGAGMINDIYGGRYGEGMLATIGELQVPYVLMHMKGTPATMQVDPQYTDVLAEVVYFFEQQSIKCRNHGIRHIIHDPGFGFGKTVAHNFELLSRLDALKPEGQPLLVGLSRKSMITKLLQISARDALNGTTILNTIALLKGADILRVHDVKEAVEAIRLVGMINPDPEI